MACESKFGANLENPILQIDQRLENLNFSLRILFEFQERPTHRRILIWNDKLPMTAVRYPHPEGSWSWDTAVIKSRSLSEYVREWRMGWDSNPREALTPAGFQDRCLQPLGHPSLGLITIKVDRHGLKMRPPIGNLDCHRHWLNCAIDNDPLALNQAAREAIWFVGHGDPGDQSL